MPEELPAPDGGAQEQQTQPTIDWESPDNPYLKRYQDTHAWGNGLNERVQKYESDPQAFLELGKGKGWIEVDEQQQGGGEDPYAERWARLEAAESRIAEHDARIAAENVAAGEELFHTDLDSWAEKDGVKLSKADHNAIFGMLMKAPDPTQESAAREVYEAHVGHKKAEREALEAEIREQMKRPRVPTTPANGQVATGTKPFHEMSRDERDQWVLERMQGG